MKRSWNVLLVLLMALPAWAQDDTSADQPPADQAAPADQSAPADSSAPADQSATGTASEEGQPAPTEDTASSDQSSSESSGEAKPWRLYVGADYAATRLSASNLTGFPTSTLDSGLVRIRAGARVLDAVALEAQFGVKQGGNGVGEAETKSYYGLFAVPTATVFETVELAFPVGYAFNKVQVPGASESLNSMAYGANLEFPLRVFGDSLPDLRFCGGGMVYYQRTNARLYGWNAGLRYDFNVQGFHVGNPFGWVKDVWPFGKGDDKSE